MDLCAWECNFIIDFPSPVILSKLPFTNNDFESLKVEQTYDFGRQNGSCHVQVTEANIVLKIKHSKIKCNGK